ncbi:MAG: SdpI family protein [Candidatus Devosia phytovorans]|uniref:SdpI family protein n=1 Tax=Candidatus Devosia phytovorans TaxID=3121372 RepID=A0AAJ5VZK1_9HYPH|nr:SdpI family protein [Devosia sp.]WEK06423.1 MAG: SdpI family protein [Devosia sp.]
MQNLVTRFHLLLLTVTLALTGVGYLRIPLTYAFPAHWSASNADWLWPRDVLLVAPLLQVVLLALFFGLGRALTKNHYAKTQHIFDPAMTLVMAVIAASQLGLLFMGIGSDLDLIRFTSFALALTLFGLGVVLFEAERHTYAGLRMPWSIRSDSAWRWVHRITGLAFALCAIALAALAWFDTGAGVLLTAFATALLLPPALAGIATLILRKA